ncbi:ATP-binding protein [Amycolatopsis regifaucium]|uniref:Kinase n=1 Tax=Amycolatopsis regifaucium TaxID=546365 RepID=A0A154MGW9_9PSEU|nr:ATP-binding protein [Amycolatopsis regifaucium]KZB83287.1 kinase [Amycolatopsis regifaucium]OKA08751.1 kinase [Amycolatopsis regifaucium]SFI96730.1 Predicted kinase [Amycolatopsis regifaucium]
MADMVVLIGLQASGKTTFFRRLFAGTHVHVSKDTFPNARRPQARQLRMLTEALGDGRSVVVDNTNPSPEEWVPLIEVARRHGAKVVGYWFPPDLAGSRRRNALRAGKTRVPDVGLYATLKRLRPPGAEDGFDELYTVGFDGEGGFVVERR